MTATRSVHARLRRYPLLRSSVRFFFAMRRALLAALRRCAPLRALVHAVFGLKHRLKVAVRHWMAIIADTVSGAWNLAPLMLSTDVAPQPAASGRIVMLVVSDLRYDPRVEREARALASAGFEIVVIFPDNSIPPIGEQPLDWGPRISFRPLPIGASSYVMGFPWLFGRTMFRAARMERPLAFHCHDLNTVMIGFAAARRAKTRWVCDFHEWSSENVSWNAKAQRWTSHPPMRRELYRKVERFGMDRASAVVTVCDSIARELEEFAPASGRRVTVIRNIPELKARPSRNYPPLKRELGIAEDCFLLLWQGGAGPTRLIEPIIEALAYSAPTVFVIRGPSLEYFGQGYRDLADNCGVGDRLILLPPVLSRDVVTAAQGADAGIWTLPNLSKNFYYALPNKIFEYLAAGLPVLAAHFPEARRLVEGNGVGLCFDPYDTRSIAAALNRMIDEPQLAARMRAAIPGLLASIDAEREWQKLVALYRGLAGDVAEAKAT
jgi:glycosyltransferase involved in cell wall biosynthesis